VSRLGDSQLSGNLLLLLARLAQDLGRQVSLQDLPRDTQESIRIP